MWLSEFFEWNFYNNSGLKYGIVPTAVLLSSVKNDSSLSKNLDYPKSTILALFS